MCGHGQKHARALCGCTRGWAAVSQPYQNNPFFLKYRNMGARSQNAFIPGRLLFKLGFIRARFCERQVTKRFYCFYSVPPRTRLQLHLDRVSSPTLCWESSLVFQQTSTIDRVTSRAANARAMPQCLLAGSRIGFSHPHLAAHASCSLVVPCKPDLRCTVNTTY